MPSPPLLEDIEMTEADWRQMETEAVLTLAKTKGFVRANTLIVNDEGYVSFFFVSVCFFFCTILLLKKKTLQKKTKKN